MRICPSHNFTNISLTEATDVTRTQQFVVKQSTAAAAATFVFPWHPKERLWTALVWLIVCANSSLIQLRVPCDTGDPWRSEAHRLPARWHQLLESCRLSTLWQPVMAWINAICRMSAASASATHWLMWLPSDNTITSSVVDKSAAALFFLKARALSVVDNSW